MYEDRVVRRPTPLSREDMEALEENGWHLLKVWVNPDHPGLLEHLIRKFTGQPPP
jgi:hypothetical protein